MEPQTKKLQFDAKQLRDLSEETTEKLPDIKRTPLYLILDSVYDTYNIGGLFRLADALAISKLYVCGESETPPNSRIKKASIGTYKVVPWTYCKTATEAIAMLRSEVPDINVVSIELAEDSIPYTDYSYSLPLALVVGNETHGVSAEALAASDAIVKLPMHGYNISLNVIVSAAVVAYHAVETS
jgi:tRNA G18 (ribose-2'-O)-methylase SpoU